jgi:hypothetical protein
MTALICFAMLFGAASGLAAMCAETSCRTISAAHTLAVSAAPLTYAGARKPGLVQS